jgi:hypothetical protein
MSEESRTDTHKPIVIPMKMELSGFRGFDRFAACHWLKAPTTGQVLILETVLRRGDDGYYRGAFYCITDANAHTDIACIGIDNDEEARYLYHRFRALNPEFYPVSRDVYLSEKRRLSEPHGNKKATNDGPGQRRKRQRGPGLLSQTHGRRDAGSDHCVTTKKGGLVDQRTQPKTKKEVKHAKDLQS